jgi:hypothetical protein
VLTGSRNALLVVMRCERSTASFHSEAAVTLFARVRVVRDDRNEKSAGLDLLADRRIRGIATPKLALLKPDLNSSGSQACADALGLILEF